jgi:hypothetical protein
MTFTGASTRVLDRAAMGRGPGTAVLPLLTGSDAGHVGDYAAQLRSRAHRLDVLAGELQDHRRRLRTVWPSGSASEAAGVRLDRTITQLADTTKLIADTAGQLQQAATVLRAAQTGFNQVVSATTPTVAALMSNPWTRGAATAMAVSTTGSLQTYFAALTKIMNAVGLDSIGRILTSLGAVTGDLAKLLGGTATPAERLSAAADVVRNGSALLQLIDGGAATPPAPVLPDLAAAGFAPAPGGTPPTAAWIPVDPATGQAVHTQAPSTSAMPAAVPAGGTTTALPGGVTPVVSSGTATPSMVDGAPPAAPAATPDHAVITTQRGDLSVTLSIATDRPAEIDLHIDTDGPDIDQHIVVGPGGRISTK